MTVIKNEKQYRIAKAQVRRFEDALGELSLQKRPANVTPRFWEAQRDAAEGQLRELRGQVEAFECLHAGGKSQALECETPPNRR